uniref:Minor core protein n=1 Tax=Thrips tabaci associated reovirus 1 TaxID=2771483 RepID=A0A7H1D339_9REOV|nr:minor core protein [Thrips tabaci associated reovirus 1]
MELETQRWIQGSPMRQKNKGKLILEMLEFRSRGLIVYGPSNVLTAKLSQRISSASGAIVIQVEATSGPFESVMQELRYGIRSATTNLLNISSIVILIHINDMYTENVKAKIAAGLRKPYATAKQINDVIYFDEMPYDTFIGYLPCAVKPTCGPLAYFAESRNEDALSTRGNFYSAILDRSNFERNVTVAFAVHVQPDCRYVYVVGYNPQYVYMALQSACLVRYLEVSRMNSDELIFPPLEPSISKTKYITHNSRLKLIDIDYTMLSLSFHVVYIGAAPGIHLYNGDVNMSRHEILAIDPAFTFGQTAHLGKAFKSSTVYTQPFSYSLQDPLHGEIVTFIKKHGDVVIIDDTYMIGDVSKQLAFDQAKFSYFENLIEANAQHIVAISSKLHYKADRVFKYVKAMLPQPRGGSLNEMRVIFTPSGKEVKYSYMRQKKYIDSFKNLDSESQYNKIMYMHRLLVINADALTYKGYIKNSVIVGMFALSNSFNNKKDVLKFVRGICENKSVIIMNSPDLSRINVYKKLDYSTGVAYSVKGDLITFKTPKGRVWKDIAYSDSDMMSAYMTSVAPEMLSGFMGDRYKGCGFIRTSSYNDLFNTYIPKFIVERHMLVQDIATSPISMVKSFTTILRSASNIPHAMMYAARGLLLRSLFDDIHVPKTAYVLINTPEATLKFVQPAKLNFSDGTCLMMSQDTLINVSGHMLSLCVAAHFLQVPVELWMHQLVQSTKYVNVPNIPDKIIYFDSLIKGGKFDVWHTLDELLLTSKILKQYIHLILGESASDEIIDSFVNVFNLTLSART